ncbi:MAG: hypothetical protein WC917_04345 [Bacilli bacterium]
MALEADEVENIPEGSPAKEVDWTFLKSTAFYAIVIGSASALLLEPNFITTPWYVLLGEFLALVSAGFWGTRTLDRTVDKLSK